MHRTRPPSLLLLAVLVGCTGKSDAEPTDTGDTHATDTDTDADPPADRDGDGYADDVDCDDRDADVNPGVATDGCDGVDDDCDGQTDEDPTRTWYLDADQDGFGDASAEPSFTACESETASYASNHADCDDGDDGVFPGADEDCDGADDDCDGSVDEGLATAVYHRDADGDGYGDSAASLEACAPVDGYVEDAADCDDADAAVSPQGVDLCDGVDDDCSGTADDDPAAWSGFYADDDGDGAGTDTIVYGCDAESAGGADNDWDCDDADATEPVFVSTSGRAGGAGTVDDPLDAIQDAIDRADTCVKVEAGTYYEDLDFGGASVSVEGLDGSGATTIVGTGSAPVVTFQSSETADAALVGFTLTGGGGEASTTTYSSWNGSYYVTYTYDYTHGGGLYVYYASPTLSDLVVTENAVYDYADSCPSTTTCYHAEGMGGGLYLVGGSPTLADVDFVANTGAVGSAVYQNYGTLTGTRIRSRENSGTFYTWYAYDGNIDLENLEIDADASDYGYGGLYMDLSTVAVRNATIVSTDYGVYAYDSTVSLDGTIVSGATYGLYDSGRSPSAWTLTYDDIEGNAYDYYGVADATGVDGNLSVDPRFTRYTDDADADADDLTLRSTSPLVDAGDPDPARNDAHGSPNDIGAYGGPAGSW